MVIEKIEIRNFRGFNGIHDELYFSPKMNIFVGINGAGKTSLLDLIAIFLNQFSNKLTGNSGKFLEYSLSHLDININEKETINRIFIHAPRYDKINLYSEIIRWKLIGKCQEISRTIKIIMIN